MQLLCDQHVPTKYIRAFEAEPWLTVGTVRDHLTPDATDEKIAAFAADDGWVVFTNDADFYRHDEIAGLVVYRQIEDPAPGDIVTSLRAIDDAYETHDDIVETVPHGWL
jgi:hypothetical protein